MNKYLKFHPFLIGTTQAIDTKYMLLSYFVSDCKYGVDEEIEFLEKVKQGDPGFDYQTLRFEDTSYGNGAGGFDFEDVLTQGLVYFESYDEKHAESFSMPIDEVIEILKEFKAYIQANQ